MKRKEIIYDLPEKNSVRRVKEGKEARIKRENKRQGINGEDHWGEKTERGRFSSEDGREKEKRNKGMD